MTKGKLCHDNLLRATLLKLQVVGFSSMRENRNYGSLLERIRSNYTLLAATSTQEQDTTFLTRTTSS